MIVLQLNCLLSWSQKSEQSYIIHPSTGLRVNQNLIDTTVNSVNISIEDIKKANIKLIEREHLIEVIRAKDEIILDYEIYKFKSDSIIKDYHSRLSAQIILNSKINNDYNKVKLENKFYRFGTIGLLGCLIIVLINK